MARPPGCLSPRRGERGWHGGSVANHPRTAVAMGQGTLSARVPVMKVPTLGDASRYLATTHAAAARSVDRFIALTEEMRRELIACGVAPERIACLPNGVRTGAYTPVDDEGRRAARTTLGLAPDRV